MLITLHSISLLFNRHVCRVGITNYNVELFMNTYTMRNIRL